MILYYIYTPENLHMELPEFLKEGVDAHPLLPTVQSIIYGSSDPTL